jgi:hypothetical protein
MSCTLKVAEKVEVEVRVASRRELLGAAYAAFISLPGPLSNLSNSTRGAGQARTFHSPEFTHRGISMSGRRIRRNMGPWTRLSILVARSPAFTAPLLAAPGTEYTSFARYGGAWHDRAASSSQFWRSSMKSKPCLGQNVVRGVVMIRTSQSCIAPHHLGMLGMLGGISQVIACCTHGRAIGLTASEDIRPHSCAVREMMRAKGVQRQWRFLQHRSASSM